MDNIEQEWTIQRHAWATLSKNGKSRDMHGQHWARMDNPETFMGNIGHKTENEDKKKKKYTTEKNKKNEQYGLKQNTGSEHSTHARRINSSYFLLNLGKSCVCNRGKIHAKGEKNPLQFEKRIFRNSQSNRDDEYIMFVAMNRKLTIEKVKPSYHVCRS